MYPNLKIVDQDLPDVLVQAKNVSTDTFVPVYLDGLVCTSPDDRRTNQVVTGWLTLL